MVRVTQNMMTNNLLRNLQRNLGRLEKLQDEMATGKKMRRPSDDPANVVNALRNRSQRTEIVKFRDNVNDGRTWLDNTDAALGEAGNVFQRIRELVVNGATGTNPTQALNAIADEIAQLREHLGQIANSKVGDRYIFGGTNTMSPPVVLGETSVLWQGNNRELRFEVGQGVTVPVNVDGGKVFGRLEAGIISASSNIAGVSFGANLGPGIINNAMFTLSTFPNPALARDEVTKLETSFPTAEYNGYQVVVSLGQAANEFNIDNDNKIITIAFDADTNDAEAQNAFLSSLAAAEVDPVPEAAYFRFYDDAQESTLEGPENQGFLAGGVDSVAAFDTATNLRTMDKTTAFDGYTVNVGLGAAGNSFVIDNDNKVITIAFDNNTNTLTTQNDFLNAKFMEEFEAASPVQFYAPAQSGSGVISSLLAPKQILTKITNGEETELQVVNREAAVITFGKDSVFAGLTVNFAEKTTMDENTGLTLNISDKSVFTLLSNIVLDLRGGKPVGDYLGSLDIVMDNFFAVRAEVGARVNRLEMNESWLTDLNINLTLLSSKMEDVDMAEAITRFTALENVYRAALSTGARIIQPSLVDFIR
ncbi:MAG: flagellar hook-associated protein FlgL [Clostridia bacterium]|nr:flagellar hook-associated protein FlgL [Clostridia bacterium]